MKSYELASIVKIVLFQMAGTVGSDELNDRKKFKGFYRTGISHKHVGAAFTELARQFEWTQMAVITQRGSLFIKVSDKSFSIFSNQLFAVLKVRESLLSAFNLEGRVLDASIMLQRRAKTFPYHLIYNLVRFSYNGMAIETNS